MAYYKNLSSLFATIENDLRKVMEQDVADKVIDIQAEEIKSEVYDKYVPVSYSRRNEHGGLMDKNNNIITFHNTKNKVEMFIQNTTRGKDDKEYITPLIISGDDGGYGRYEYPTYGRDPSKHTYLKPRDFIASTKRRLARTTELKDVVIGGLSKYGYKFYK